MTRDHLQICEITAANDSRMGETRGQMTKSFLNFQKLPQTTSERLDLFSCLEDHEFYGGRGGHPKIILDHRLEVKKGSYERSLILQL